MEIFVSTRSQLTLQFLYKPSLQVYNILVPCAQERWRKNNQPICIEDPLSNQGGHHEATMKPTCFVRSSLCLCAKCLCALARQTGVAHSNGLLPCSAEWVTSSVKEDTKQEGWNSALKGHRCPKCVHARVEAKHDYTANQSHKEPTPANPTTQRVNK